MIFREDNNVNKQEKERGTMTKKEMRGQSVKDSRGKIQEQQTSGVIPSVAFLVPPEKGNTEMTQIMNLNTKDLISSQSYQRDVDQKRVSYIVTNYDPHKFGIIKVSFRDGKYYVFDGQHRIAAFKVLNGDQGWDCEM